MTVIQPCYWALCPLDNVCFVHSCLDSIFLDGIARSSSWHPCPPGTCPLSPATGWPLFLLKGHLTAAFPYRAKHLVHLPPLGVTPPPGAEWGASERCAPWPHGISPRQMGQQGGAETLGPAPAPASPRLCPGLLPHGRVTSEMLVLVSQGRGCWPSPGRMGRPGP